MRIRGWNMVGVSLGISYDDVGKAFSDAISAPVENVTNAVEKAFTDPTKLTLGDAASITLPIPGGLIKSEIEHPEVIPAQLAIAAGASFALEGGTIFESAGLKSAASPITTTPTGPLFAPTPGFGVSTSNLNLAAAGAPSIGGVPTSLGASATPGFFSSLLGGFSTQGGKVGIGDAIVNGFGNIGSVLGQTAPLLLLSQALGGKGGGAGGLTAGSTGFNLSIPQGLRDAASNFFPGFGGAGSVSDPGSQDKPIEAGFSPIMIVLLVGAGLGVLYFFIKRRK